MIFFLGFILGSIASSIGLFLYFRNRITQSNNFIKELLNSEKSFAELSKSISLSEMDRIYYESLHRKIQLQSENLEKVKFNIAQYENTIESVMNFSNRFLEVSQSQSSSTAEMAGVSEEFFASIHSVSTAVVEQSEKIHFANDKIEDIVYQMITIQADLDTLGHKSKNLSQKIINGERSIQSVIDSMNQIYELSHKIKDIAAVISDISDQTNLLSLNASIEAARSGDKGLGFAVVAKEIGKLSEKTAGSVKEIENFLKITSQKILIGQTNVTHANQIIKDMLNWAKELNEHNQSFFQIILQQSKKIQEISESIKIIDSRGNDIEIATKEQTNAITEITNTSNQLAQEAENIYMNALELSAITDDLKRINTLFKEIFREF